MLQNQTKCHHLRARECKCKCLQLMGHLFDSPVQVPCLPIALQQLWVATCTNWQPPGAKSGDFCLNHIETAPWKPMMYIHKIPLKFGVCKKVALYRVHVTGDDHDMCLHIVYYDVLCCLWMLMAAYGSVLQIFHG